MKQNEIIRVKYVEFKESKLTVKTLSNEVIKICCNEEQTGELNQLQLFLNQDSLLNLIHFRENENGNFIEFFIYEPDYLIDISSLSECVKPYGNHPLNYSLARLQNRETTSPILAGNIANYFMDELIYEEEDQKDYIFLLKKLFQTMAFDLSVCKDLTEPHKEREFFENCKKHYLNIRKVIEDLFPRANIDKDKVILEPSFISNALGLQGRMDILLSDFSTLIELKSGKAIEDFRTGGQFIRSAANHYTQMILYLSVLEFNMDLDPDSISSYLLYSKYPVLSKERHIRRKLIDALSLRNKIVAYEQFIQTANNMEVTRRVVEKINSFHLNVEKLTGNFFDNYLAPSIDSFYKAYAALNELEKTYFLRLYTFVVKELWLSKAGEREYEGVKKASVLWNAPFEDKLTTGEILFDLKILRNKAFEEEHAITLQIPLYKDMYMPNFRQGDSIVLYERNREKDNVNNHQVFKGVIEKIESGEITIKLRYRQKNNSVWNKESYYAMEHDYMDTTYVSMFRALNTFLSANQDRKDLLLCQRIPADNSECFLLVGPPGTGKTSVSLKNIVENQLKEEKGDILLLSYTNRAVDEICKALSSISENISYIRIGNFLSCAPEYREKLLEKQLNKCINRKEVNSVIWECRIFTGTVASVWNKSEILKLKQFDLCIIDEATQLLEPHLLGILCEKTKENNNAIKKFVMIGDHKQLPAVVLQKKEESCVREAILNEIGLTDLSNSLFERLYRKYSQENKSYLLDLLFRQGRMHPDICAFPSKYFYNGMLTSVGLPHQKEIWKDEKRIHFYSVLPYPEENSPKINVQEAEAVVQICMNLYKKLRESSISFLPETIGIITPFRNQIALIRKKLGETEIPEFRDIMIDTVERYQGSQKDIIIYSFCIKNELQLKMLPSWTEENGTLIDRKLNVALTRAKKQLFIIGNKLLLSQNPIYKALIDHISETDATTNDTNNSFTG